MQTNISVSVQAVLATYETILNLILAALITKNETNYILCKRIPKCYYDNIASVLVLKTLYTNQKVKLEFMEIFVVNLKIF